MNKFYVYKQSNKEYIGAWNNIKECSIALDNLDRSNISKALAGDLKSVGGYIFSNKRIYNQINKKKTKLDRLTNEFIEQISMQELEMLTHNNYKTDYIYKKHLNDIEERVNNIYANVEDDEEAYNMIWDLVTQFKTWYDYLIIDLNKHNPKFDKYRNPHLKR